MITNIYKQNQLKIIDIIIKNFSIKMYNLTLFLTITLCCTFTKNVTAQKNKLIEFGWDYPNVAALSKNLPSLQQTPFNGICFSLQTDIIEAFDKKVKPTNYFELEKLKKLAWGKYTDNYIIVRCYGKDGGCWFDDSIWTNFETNAVLLSMALNNKNIQGIMLDAEYYYDDMLYNPWLYNEKAYPKKTYIEIASKVKERGMQYMYALQKYKPNIQVISIWLASLIAQEIKYTPLLKTRHALLIPFLEGMLIAKNKQATIIDGNEYAYWNTTPLEFFNSKEMIHSTLLKLFETDIAKKKIASIEIAQPVFYDGIMALATRFEKGLTQTKKWQWLTENTKLAMAASDNITWFYNERINWWNGHVNDTLVKILNNKQLTYTQSPLQKSNTKTSLVFKSNACMYLQKGEIPVHETKMAFTYTVQLPFLQLQFVNELPQQVAVYLNNILVKTVINVGFKNKIKLPFRKNNKIAIIANYSNNQQAFGYWQN